MLGWMFVIGVAIFVLWHFLPQRQDRPLQPSPKYRQDPRITLDQDQWQAFVEEHCESPAEIAFLRAMINGFDMKPESGSLVAEGMRLDFQVEERRYRVDFLINGWLVVEIDGAAYHSSPEAIARDKQRDRAFEGLGYTVLRIPARQVFNQPTLAIDRVAAALKVGKRTLKTPPPQEQVDGFTRLGQTLSGFSKGISEANARIERSRAITAALAQAERATVLENNLLDQVIAGARSKVELDDWLSEDAERSAEFEELSAMISAAPGPDLDQPVTIDRIEFLPPVLTGNTDTDAYIESGYEHLISKRRTAHLTAQQTLKREPRLRAHVEEALTSIGWRDLWEQVR